LASKIAEVEVKRGSKKKIIKVPAEICQRCGERIYPRHSEEMIIQAEQELLLSD
jgi:YgiT-type zinc finger domain-containing protein